MRRYIYCDITPAFAKEYPPSLLPSSEFARICYTPVALDRCLVANPDLRHLNSVFFFSPELPQPGSPLYILYFASLAA